MTYYLPTKSKGFMLILSAPPKLLAMPLPIPAEIHTRFSLHR